MQTRIPRVTIFALALTCSAPVLGQVIERPAANARLAQDVAKAAQEAQLDAEAQQYLRMMQPLMWRELEFVRQTCDLTPEQRPKVKAAAEQGVKQAARDMANPQRNARAGMVSFAHQTIRNDLAKALQLTLTPEQLRQYQAEAQPRMAAYRQAAIATAVAQLDDVLYFSEEQREKVSQALESNWKEEWEQWVIMWRYAGRYYPPVPDQLFVVLLSEEQKEVWRGLTKTTINSWGGQVARDAADDKWWEGK